MSKTLTQNRGTTTGCVEFSALFQDPLLEEPPSTTAPGESRRRYSQLMTAAHTVCSACPVIEQCLYQAVVDHDVAGYLAGSTQRRRLEIRRRLAITVQPEDFDTLAGVTRRNRQVDHDEVVRLRNANPHESLESLAQRLGCSLSTVKRHLKRERNTAEVTFFRAQKPPTTEDVMAAFAAITRAASPTPRAA
ncbi:MAG: WhiB family transcriptional regulator [Propionibacteriaceae bacterium]|nr:WhiB family transcriptional regulator [Propionibacteriaceae bacterium]